MLPTAQLFNKGKPSQYVGTALNLKGDIYIWYIFLVNILQKQLFLFHLYISEDGLDCSGVLIKALLTPFWPAQSSSQTLIWSKDTVSSCFICFIPTMIVNCLTIMLDSHKVWGDFAGSSENSSQPQGCYDHWIPFWGYTFSLIVGTANTHWEDDHH